MSLAHVFDWDPPSESIAAALNASGRNVCCHNRSPCFVFCGVWQCDPTSRTWSPIPSDRRAAWFGRFYGMYFRDREKAYDENWRKVRFQGEL